ncbi:hypothetical protein BDQ17DRAFT_1400112 [Cyathus striatus]|nr:hypothetical protein BDQ17DRAFT_1400112 [Cyathus striatus]
MSNKDTVKDKTKRFIRKVKESFSGQPQESEPGPATSAQYPANDHDSYFLTSFSSLSLSPSIVTNGPPGGQPFVGGFYKPTQMSSVPSIPPHANDSSFAASRPSLMPVPSAPARQSLTMQMALRPDNFDSNELTNRPHSAPSIPCQSIKPSMSAPPGIQPVSSPIYAKRNNKAKSSSSVSVSTISSNTQFSQVRCAGITKAGEQCSRMVKIGPPLAQMGGDGETTEPITRFCFQHRKEVLQSTGFYSITNGEWITISDWIPNYLQPDTQAAILAELKKPGSSSDVHGYIYTYEIRTPGTETIKLKVGRTTNIVRRLDQWSKQCGSKEPIPRGFYPGSVEYENQGGLVKGMVKPGDKTPWTFRLERLIHLELADLAATAIYLDGQWPRSKDSENISSPAKTNAKSSTKLVPEVCPDCGKVHKEIFEFQRWRYGVNVGKEWSIVVQPVINRWGNFVNQYL